MAWKTARGFGNWCSFNAPNKGADEPGIGVHLHVLMPGESNGYYHAEAAQEGFVVLSGECIAVVEGQERVMRQWDYLALAARDRPHNGGRGHRPLRDLDVRQS